jgi:hypothetical protein
VVGALCVMVTGALVLDNQETWRATSVRGCRAMGGYGLGGSCGSSGGFRVGLDGGVI